MTRRSDRFRLRVNAERQLIDTVNVPIRSGDLHLAGLSVGAIDDWNRRARQILPQSVVGQLVNVLTEAGRRTGSLADNSRGVFGSEQIREDEIEAVVQEIRRILS